MATGPSTDQTPYLIGLEPNVSFVSLITAGDSVLQTDGGGLYQFGGIPDGLGAFDNGDGTVTVLVNHEFGQTKGAIHDHGSAGAYVDALIIDKTTLEVVSGDNLAQQVYLWDPSTDSYAAGTTAWERLCSGDLASPSAFYDAASGLGTTARIYLTGEETSPPFTTNYGRAFGFVASGADAGSVYELNMLGDMSFENQVACAYSGAKTVVLETDDATPGQVYVYVGDKQATGNDIEKAGLTNGQLYGIKVAGLTVEDAVNTVPGGFASFSLESMGDISDDNGTHLEINADAAGVTEFFRPEDISWDPTNPNYAYFVTTGNISAPSRLYRLEFTDVTNPTLGGNINLMFEGPASSAPS
ncbi:MAG: alkaline phosphatase PhoX, partial [Caulobacteraceae bacterium]